MVEIRKLMPKQVSVCGLYCGFCPAFRKKTCPGCFKVNEKAKKSCAPYRCVLSKGLHTCLLCEEFPCSIHYEKGLVFKHTFLDCIKKGRTSVSLQSEKKNS